jgi:predicted RNase H-like HicB family nuclease
MVFEVDFELEDDGRWIAAMDQLPGVLAYGSTREEARANAEALARAIVLEAASYRVCRILS